MFEVLSGKLGEVFRRLTSKGRLTEKDVDEALRQVRLALLEADVNLKVVKDFVGRIRERALGAEVRESLTPGQQVVKIVNEELVGVLGGGQRRLSFASQPPTVMLLVGLQGSGKTTTAAKLARHLRQTGQRPLLVAADPYRPAATEQITILGRQLDIPVFGEGKDVPAIGEGALKRARQLAASTVIVDTAGRLHVDEELMQELEDLKARVSPTEVLLVADAMTGQEAVRIAQEFHSRVGLTGIILTKMDGDARGGAALSVTAVTGVPIKFIGTGEKVDALETFYPDRLASRILGMGDVLSLIEKAETSFDQQKAKVLEKKMRHGQFDLEDLLDQFRQIRGMGPIGQLIEMIPGLSSLPRQLPAGMEEKQLQKAEAMVCSMTPAERRNPNIIDGSRRRRIARGSGTTPQDINQLLNQFRQMQKMMKRLSMGRNILSIFK